MSSKQDVFSFDLNESLYFEKGQEVSQILSISLDPEISIQSFNEYVSIRGVIELHGEYEKSTINSENEAQSLDFNEQQSLRYVEQIRNEADNLVTFSHRFPVEISVPSYRVDNMNDITVSVASFDYEIPKEDHLKLISTIEIHGISNQTTFPEIINDRSDHETSKQKVEMAEETFQFELKEELLDAREDEVIEQSLTPEESVPKAAETGGEAEDKDRWKYKQTQSFEEFFKVDDAEEVDSKEEDENIPADIDVMEDMETDSEPERKPSYLSDLFGGDESDDEIKYEQMRICIVQDQDTLESISERYQVPKLQLLKLNRLADDDLSKGQLLSIPSKKES